MHSCWKFRIDKAKSTGSQLGGRPIGRKTYVVEDQAGSRLEIWEKDTLGKGAGWGKGSDKQKQGEFEKQNTFGLSVLEEHWESILKRST